MSDSRKIFSSLADLTEMQKEIDLEKLNRKEQAMTIHYIQEDEDTDKDFSNEDYKFKKMNQLGDVFLINAMNQKLQSANNNQLPAVNNHDDKINHVTSSSRNHGHKNLYLNRHLYATFRPRESGRFTPMDNTQKEQVKSILKKPKPSQSRYKKKYDSDEDYIPESDSPRVKR